MWTSGTDSGDQAAVLFLKPKTSTQMLQSLLRTKQTENWHPWKAFSFLSFVPAFVSTILVSCEWGNLHFSKFCPSVRATGLPAFVAQREKKKKEDSGFPLFSGFHWQKRSYLNSSLCTQRGTKLKLGLSEKFQ